MTDKELRKLNRADLVELLLMQSRAAEQQEREMEELKAQLESRKIMLEEAGSIAQAALKLNGVFEAAQAAADQYQEQFAIREEEFKHKCEEMEKLAAERSQALEGRCRKLDEESRRVCEERERKTRERCEAMLEDTKKHIRDMAEAEAGERLKAVTLQLRAFADENRKLEPIIQKCLEILDISSAP